MNKFSDLKGQILIDVYKDKGYQNLDVIKFITLDLRTFALECHEDLRDTESYLESIDGDLEDLKNTEILLAEEIEETKGDIRFVFYKLSTIKGDVTLRFNYTEAPWYSGSVEFKEIDTDFTKISDVYTAMLLNTHHDILNNAINAELYDLINNVKKYRNLTTNEKAVIKSIQNSFYSNSITNILEEKENEKLL